MTEQEQTYVELYPIYKTLCKDVENNIIQKNKNISVDSGNNTFIDSTFGKLIYTEDITEVRVAYHLESSKYKEEFKRQLSALYSEYYRVDIIEENVEKKLFKEACDLIVKIDCMANKVRYLKLGVVEKQKLLEQAVLNIQNGLVVFPEEDFENKSRK